jgi:hypothetical protein
LRATNRVWILIRNSVWVPHCYPLLEKRSPKCHVLWIQNIQLNIAQIIRNYCFLINLINVLSDRIRTLDVVSILKMFLPWQCKRKW